jgi:hypothetical protein
LGTKISTFCNFSGGFSPKYISVPNFKSLAIVEVPNLFDESVSKSVSQSVAKKCNFFDFQSLITFKLPKSEFWNFLGFVIFTWPFQRYQNYFTGCHRFWVTGCSKYTEIVPVKSGGSAELGWCATAHPDIYIYTNKSAETGLWLYGFRVNYLRKLRNLRKLRVSI